MTYSTTAKAVQAGLLTAASLLALGAAPAQATTQDSFPGNWLFLTVAKGDVRHSDTHGTLLMCNPPQGHGKAAEACAELEPVGGDIAGLRPQDVHCPMIYTPVTAHARGQWQGRPVEYQETFSNACVLGARTGSVFALDA
jgi:hypothetical protein